MSRFPNQFSSFVCAGDSLQVKIDGITYTARIEPDPFADIDDDDCHNLDQSITGCNEYQQRRLINAREAYKRDEWFYCGITLHARHDATGANWDSLESPWRIEANYPDSYNTYLTEVANELLASAVEQVQDKIRELTATA